MNTHPHDASNPISLKDKRLNLIRAVQDLGIDKESFCYFLQNAIDSENHLLNIAKDNFTYREIFTREKGILEGDLVLTILRNF